MNTHDLWTVSLEIDVALERLYRWLTERFEYDRDVEGTFDVLANLKRGHRDLIQNQRKMSGFKGKPLLRVTTDPDEIRSLLHDAEVLQNDAESLDLLRAIEVSKSLENAAADKVYNSVEGGLDPIAASVIEKLSRDASRCCGILDGLRARVLGMVS